MFIQEHNNANNNNIMMKRVNPNKQAKQPTLIYNNYNIRPNDDIT